MTDRLLKIPEAAALLSLGKTLTRELIAKGELRHVKVTERAIRVPMSAVEEYIRRKATPTEANPEPRTRTQPPVRTALRTIDVTRTTKA